MTRLRTESDGSRSAARASEPRSSVKDFRHQKMRFFENINQGPYGILFCFELRWKWITPLFIAGKTGSMDPGSSYLRTT